jgi:hypothetical protein
MDSMPSATLVNFVHLPTQPSGSFATLKSTPPGLASTVVKLWMELRSSAPHASPFRLTDPHPVGPLPVTGSIKTRQPLRLNLCLEPSENIVS